MKRLSYSRIDLVAPERIGPVYGSENDDKRYVGLSASEGTTSVSFRVEDVEALISGLREAQAWADGKGSWPGRKVLKR